MVGIEIPDIPLKDEGEFGEEITKGEFKGVVISVRMVESHPKTGTPFPFGKLLYIEIQPDPSLGWENQGILCNPETKTKLSKWYYVQSAFKKLGYKNIKEVLGKAFLFREEMVEVGARGEKQAVILPIKDITPPKKEAKSL
ncbi:hypothetical protein DRN50_07350 [Thermococci archaeon]|nr:MAG: hypothetical protein DRN50_07350 [Thermococci archaeon]